MLDSTTVGSILGTGIGVVAGGVITWLAAREYYLKSGKDLQREATALRRKSDMILTGLEKAGMLELHRDPATGEVRGLLLRLQGTMIAGTSVNTGQLTPQVIRREPNTRTDDPDDGPSTP